MKGNGVRKNMKQAVKWFLAAASQGHANAQNNLAVCYIQGQGVEQDTQQALVWFMAAAAQGHQGAINSLHKLGY